MKKELVLLESKYLENGEHFEVMLRMAIETYINNEKFYPFYRQNASNDIEYK